MTRLGIGSLLEGSRDGQIEEVAKKLGAEVVGTVPDYSAGAFGVAKLTRTLRERLVPSRASRQGRRN